MYILSYTVLFYFISNSFKMVKMKEERHKVKRLTEVEM